MLFIRHEIDENHKEKSKNGWKYQCNELKFDKKKALTYFSLYSPILTSYPFSDVTPSLLWHLAPCLFSLRLGTSNPYGTYCLREARIRLLTINILGQSLVPQIECKVGHLFSLRCSRRRKWWWFLIQCLGVEFRWSRAFSDHRSFGTKV